MLIFRKSPWSSRIKHKSWKNQLSMKENTDFFLGRKQNGRKETRNAFSLEKTYYVTNISSRLNFQEYIIRFFTCVLFFQMLIKYLKVSVLYEWTAVHCLLFKASGSMSDFLESMTYLSLEKFKASNERHKADAFLNCKLGSSFSKLVIH